MTDPLTTGEKVETAAITLACFVFMVFALFGGVGIFYFLVWGIA